MEGNRVRQSILRTKIMNPNELRYETLRANTELVARIGEWDIFTASRSMISPDPLVRDIFAVKENFNAFGFRFVGGIDDPKVVEFMVAYNNLLS